MALPRLIPLEDFFAPPSFSKPAISPDGTRLAYLAPSHGHLNVWIRGIDQERSDAVCVTHSTTRGIPNFYWTTDPRWLLFRQDTDGNEDWHYYRVDLENPDAEPVDLTPLPPGCRAMGGEHPTKPGKFFAVMNPRYLFMDTFEIDIATGDTTVLLESSDMLSSYTDVEGSKGFFMTQAADGSREIYAVDDRLAGEMRLVHSEEGPCWPLGQFPIYVDPANTYVVLASYEGGSDDSRLIRIEHSGEKSVFAEKPGHSVCSLGAFEEDFGRPQSIVISPRSYAITAVRFVGDRPELMPVDPHFAEVHAELMKLGDGGELGWLSCDRSEQVWVVTFIHDRRPGLSYSYDHRTRTSKLLNDPSISLDPADLAATESVRFKARDGLPLHAFLTLPVGVEPKNLPLVVRLHGGPWIHDIWMFNTEVQILANRGYAVLQVNFRGSSGYGRNHTVAAIREWAGAMHTDVIDACDWAVEQGIADPARLGIYGGSYGGYETLVGVTVTPDYFAAAIDYVGLSSIPAFMGDLPEWVKPLNKNSFITHCGDPDDPDDPDDLADMLSRSPVTMLDKIVTPLLVIQGAQDARVKQSESDAIVDGLRARGVEVEYFVAEDEGHDFKNPANLITKWQLAEKHLAQHLGGRSTQSP